MKLKHVTEMKGDIVKQDTKTKPARKLAIAGLTISVASLVLLETLSGVANAKTAKPKEPVCACQEVNLSSLWDPGALIHLIGDPRLSADIRETAQKQLTRVIDTRLSERALTDLAGGRIAHMRFSNEVREAAVKTLIQKAVETRDKRILDDMGKDPFANIDDILGKEWVKKLISEAYKKIDIDTVKHLVIELELNEKNNGKNSMLVRKLEDIVTKSPYADLVAKPFLEYLARQNDRGTIAYIFVSASSKEVQAIARKTWQEQCRRDNGLLSCYFY